MRLLILLYRGGLLAERLLTSVLRCYVYIIYWSVAYNCFVTFTINDNEPNNYPVQVKTTLFIRIFMSDSIGWCVCWLGAFVIWAFKV